MAYPSRAPWFDVYLKSLDDNELVALGGALEEQLEAIRTELQSIGPEVAKEKRDLKIAAIKLGINSGLGGIAILMAPFDFGLSLIVTVASSGMIFWDSVDFAKKGVKYETNHQRQRTLRIEESDIEDKLKAIFAEINRR